jgi:hypothetical protein
MIKKLKLLAMVAGAPAVLAFPSMAGAAQLTQPAGTRVPIGTVVFGTSTNTVTNVGAFTLKCEKVTIGGVVKANNGKEWDITMHEPSIDSTKNCQLVGVGAINIDPTLRDIKAAGAGPGTAEFEFNAEGLCEEASVMSEVTWTGTDVIDIKAAVNGGCGKGNLLGDFTLETTAGLPIVAEL